MFFCNTKYFFNLREKNIFFRDYSILVSEGKYAVHSKTWIRTESIKFKANASRIANSSGTSKNRQYIQNLTE